MHLSSVSRLTFTGQTNNHSFFENMVHFLKQQALWSPLSWGTPIVVVVFSQHQIFFWLISWVNICTVWIQHWQPISGACLLWQLLWGGALKAYQMNDSVWLWFSYFLKSRSETKLWYLRNIWKCSIHVGAACCLPEILLQGSCCWHASEYDGLAPPLAFCFLFIASWPTS